ncbi:epoxide hydrolase [Bradyrhizobium macuxiense]|uniref:Epoxide hydrolase n=1 Tax=Bradyrhizobium macuxiense TaxID=1755647 RepID=A0A120FLY0_9BRAD|nr:alpha/beta hydrolase [Bradyrhizobium macuxiense]KWV52956.1 epoxide hydrolase [Bradyrhizobium macuxiense]
MTFAVTEHTVKTARHTTGYLACGAQAGPLLIFCHGWPEISLSWRHQLPTFASLGFRCVAPDLRGYGRSSTYTRVEDFAQEVIVQDMLELLAALGRERAVWIGHDAGSMVVWNIAAHHPDKTVGVASLTIPYLPQGFTLDSLVPLVDRKTYPEAEYPVGQWDYICFYHESFDRACAAFDANPRNVIKALFRKGNPDGKGKPSRTAAVRKAGGWFGGPPFPDLPHDPDVISEQDLEAYAAALTRNGFFGPDAWYMNYNANNTAYSRRAVNGGKLSMPALFLHGAYDYVAETMTSKLAEPMRRDCSDLTEVVVKSGHWMAQEKPAEVNAALAMWLARKLPDYWPGEPKGEMIDTP